MRLPWLNLPCEIHRKLISGLAFCYIFEKLIEEFASNNTKFEPYAVNLQLVSCILTTVLHDTHRKKYNETGRGALGVC
jgi:hypothetical protein